MAQSDTNKPISFTAAGAKRVIDATRRIENNIPIYGPGNGYDTPHPLTPYWAIVTDNSTARTDISDGWYYGIEERIEDRDSTPKPIWRTPVNPKTDTKAINAAEPLYGVPVAVGSYVLVTPGYDHNGILVNAFLAGMGQSGFSGVSGYSGAPGPPGSEGTSGADGESGASGYSGESGYSGFSGASGYSGASGFSGVSGYSGFSGKSGYSGIAGTNGTNGTNGASGFSGYSGATGPPGTPSGFTGTVQVAINTSPGTKTLTFTNGLLTSVTTP